MNSTLNITVISTINILSLLLLLYSIKQNTSINKNTANAFTLTIILTSFVILCEALTHIFDTMGPQARTANIIANILGFSLSTCIPITLAVLFDKNLYKHIFLICTPLVLNFIALICSIKTQWIFFITPENKYLRGPFFIIYVATYSFSIIIFVIATFKSSLTLLKKDKILIFVLLLIVAAGTSIQIINPSIIVTWHCVTLVLIMYYIFLREIEFKYDVMTSMLNRQAFENKIERLYKVNQIYIVIIDVNEFKRINDTYGHLKGDHCLKIIAKLIKKCFHKTGTYYRIGGDEFCVLCEHTTKEEFLKCIDYLNKSIMIEKEKDSIIPSVSLGYCLYDKEKHGDLLTAFKKADENMYQNKKSSVL